jgi:hypothetical protein
MPCILFFRPFQSYPNRKIELEEFLRDTIVARAAQTATPFLTVDSILSKRCLKRARRVPSAGWHLTFGGRRGGIEQFPV